MGKIGTIHINAERQAEQGLILNEPLTNRGRLRTPAFGPV